MASLNLTVATREGACFNVKIDPSKTVRHLKEAVAAASRIPADNQQLMTFANRELVDSDTVASYGLTQGEVLVLVPTARPMRPAGQIPAVGASRAAPGVTPPMPPPQHMALLVDHIRNSPLLTSLVVQNPALQRALDSGDHQAIWDRVYPMLRQGLSYAMQGVDENDPEVQRRIYQELKRKRLQEQLQSIEEHQPELLYGHVHMLYVSMEINDRPVKAFVDSGAQSTIMGIHYARELGLEPWIDERFAGIAQGVGTSRILGRVHAAKAKIGDHVVNISVTVLEDEKMDFLFGLDNLKRHRCSIDLAQNALVFTEIDTKLPFLAEHELPSNAFGRAKTEGGPGNAPDAAGAGTSGAGAGKEAAEGPSKGQGSGKDGGDRNTREGEKGGGLGVGGGGTASGEGREKEGAAGAGSSGGVDRSKIAELMGLGFPEAICIQALESCNGDVEAAASMLFSLQE